MKIETNQLLQREELKKVYGGYDPEGNGWPCYDSGCLTHCGDQGTWLWENSSMSDQQIQDWYMGCMDSCCNG